jgi:hypothetical protein
VDIETGAPKDLSTDGIMDLYATKWWAVKLATDAVITVLKVDQIIMAKQVSAELRTYMSSCGCCSALTRQLNGWAARVHKLLSRCGCCSALTRHLCGGADCVDKLLSRLGGLECALKRVLSTTWLSSGAG